jgi:putative oxidoreductase
VAYLTASRDTIKHLFTQNPDAFINDAAFPFLVISVLILAFGPGKISIDHMVLKLWIRRVTREEFGVHGPSLLTV